MKNLFAALVFSLLSISTALASAAQPFPKSPDPTLTPGSLCDKPTSKRYPEGIPYCARSVHSDLKREVMGTYDTQLGYQVRSMNRSDFKIDHYIPLCMGGSNNANNLWPQHSSVYKITDELEFLACVKMSEGKLRQADAVALIKRAKANLDEVAALTAQIREL